MLALPAHDPAAALHQVAECLTQLADRAAAGAEAAALERPAEAALLTFAAGELNRVAAAARAEIRRLRAAGAPA